MKPKRKATILDVARLAGVAPMTVSRVLNGSASVAEETLRRVQEAIAKLDYKPNELARALRNSRSRSIGVIVPYLSDPFFAICAHSINKVARQRGYSVMLTTSDENPETESSEASLLLRRHIEGLILIPATENGSRIDISEFAATPIVTLDRPSGLARCDSVLVDNRDGARQAVEHLIQRHRARVAFLGLSLDLYTMRERYAGYREAVLSAGLEPTAPVPCDSEDAATGQVRGLLRSPQPPTALFCANNLVTKFALHALFRLGLTVPDDMALIGFDDFELADTLQPPITVIRQPIAELGSTAAELLFQRITNATIQPGRQRTLPVELVLRRSCGCPPVEEQLPVPAASLPYSSKLA
jgi:LacI family transcriptional regulator